MNSGYLGIVQMAVDDGETLGTSTFLDTFPHDHSVVAVARINLDIVWLWTRDCQLFHAVALVQVLTARTHTKA